MSPLDLLWLLCSLRLVAAAGRTIAIDDTYGDEATGVLPVYSPASQWSQGRPCALDDDECLVRPDPSMVRNGTWHDSVGSTDDAPPRTIDLAFEGNSISVYCIVSEVDRIEIAVSNMTFQLDGQDAGKFYHDVSGQQDAAGNYAIQYNVQVFNGSVPDGNHTLRISSVGYSRMLFDYALYTTSTDLANATVSPPLPSPTASGPATTDASRGTHLSTGVIAGAAVAGTLGLLAIGILFFVLVRRRRRLTTSYSSNYAEAGSKSKRWFYGRSDDIAGTRASSIVSLPYEESPTSTHPYPHSVYSHHRGDADGSSREPSPSDSSVPLMEFAAPPPDPFLRGQEPRVVVVGDETRLEGPDNSMARLARKQIAEREAELMRRVREVENALATRRSTNRASRSVDSPSILLTSQLHPSHTTSDEVSTTASQARDGTSEAVLRDQLNELRAEMEQMKILQQQMTLEIREAIEPPPGYQAT